MHLPVSKLQPLLVNAMKSNQTSTYQIQPTSGNRLKVQIDTGIPLGQGNVKINRTVTTRRDAVDQLHRYLVDNPDVDLYA